MTVMYFVKRDRHLAHVKYLLAIGEYFTVLLNVKALHAVFFEEHVLLVYASFLASDWFRLFHYHQLAISATSFQSLFRRADCRFNLGWASVISLDSIHWSAYKCHFIVNDASITTILVEVLSRCRALC